MKLDSKDIKASDIVSVSDYVSELRLKTGVETISNSTVHYHLQNTELLDYVEISGVKFIVRNEKSNTYNPGSYYGSHRVRQMKKISLKK